jgi:hypothetical protein
MYTSKPHLIVVTNMVVRFYSLLGAHCIRLVKLIVGMVGGGTYCTS